ncbi:MAG: CmcJ/NvfI family oxidoreductase [Sandaracinaceae bacterium]
MPALDTAKDAPTSVSTELCFIRPPADRKPAFLSAALNGGRPKYLFESEARSVRVHDLRVRHPKPSVDREGFELHRAPSAVEDLHDDAQVDRVYRPEVEELLRACLGATEVVTFDVTRRSDAAQGASNPDGSRGPATRVHVDYTVASGPKRAAQVLGEERARSHLEAGGRILQVNVWRPIRGPVERAPLAVADASSIAPADLIATDQRFPGRTGEIYLLRHAPGQRWYYAPRMTRDEVLLLKGWDSSDDGRARFTPHSAFQLPDTPAGAAPRESFEVRAFVLVNAG